MLLLVALSREPKPVRWYSSGWMVIPAFLIYVGTLGAAAIAVRTFLLQPFSIVASSMSPTLIEGDYVSVSKWTYGYSRYSAPFGLLPVNGRFLGGQVERGDVVVFRHPSQSDMDYIERIIGLPGDKIQMVGGVLHIDGNPVSRNHTRDVQDTLATGTDEAVAVYRETLPSGVTYDTFDIGADGPLDNMAEQFVPEGTYFVLGDNRDNSADSRVWETVPEGNLIGRVERIYWNARGLPFAARSERLIETR